MGLPLASGRAPNGHWLDFDTLAEELRQFVEQQQEEQQQEQVGQQSQAVAQQADAAEAGSSESSGNGQGSGTTSGSSSISSSQPQIFLPTQQELRAGGRADLIGGIRLHGGSLAVAGRLGWGVRRGKLPSEAAVVQQLLEFVTAQQQEQQQEGSVGEEEQPAAQLAMPTLRQLQEGGRADLATAVLKLGGVPVFAHLLEVEQQRRQQVGAQAAAQQAQQQQQQGGDGQEAEAEAQQSPQRRFVLHEGRQHEGAAHILSYPPGSITSGGSGTGPGAGGMASSLAGSGSSRRWAGLAQPPQPAVVRVGEALLQLIEARGWERRVPTKQVRGWQGGVSCWRHC